jgi:DNA modification methylase
LPHWEPIPYFGPVRKSAAVFWGSDVFTCNVEFGRARHGHPTPKPLALMRDILGRFPSTTVFCDPFAGSGTTLLAARQLGRRAIGIEISEPYVETAIRRLENDAPLLAWGERHATQAALWPSTIAEAAD